MNMKIMLTTALITLTIAAAIIITPGGVQGPIKFGAIAAPHTTAPSSTQTQPEQATQKPVTAAASAF
jgi:hypothetical protein